MINPSEQTIKPTLWTSLFSEHSFKILQIINRFIMGQAFTQFEVGNRCGVTKVVEKCTINWGQTGIGLIVKDIGGVKRGDFDFNGDIAGTGVNISPARHDL